MAALQTLRELQLGRLQAECLLPEKCRRLLLSACSLVVLFLALFILSGRLQRARLLACMPRIGKGGRMKDMMAEVGALPFIRIW